MFFPTRERETASYRLSLAIRADQSANFLNGTMMPGIIKITRYGFFSPEEMTPLAPAIVGTGSEVWEIATLQPNEASQLSRPVIYGGYAEIITHMPGPFTVLFVLSDSENPRERGSVWDSGEQTGTRHK